VPGLTHEQLLATASLYEKHGGSCLQAARELGISRTTFATRVEIAITKGYITSKIEAVRSENDGPVEIKKVFLKPQYNIYQRENTSDVNCRVLAIGDSHDGPDIPDKSRFTAMGAYARINNIEQIVQIGDFCSMDSMSTHDPNWTLKGHEKPSFKDDVNSFREALVAFDEGLAGHNATKHVTLGNHEDRSMSPSATTRTESGALLTTIPKLQSCCSKRFTNSCLTSGGTTAHSGRSILSVMLVSLMCL